MKTLLAALLLVALPLTTGCEQTQTVTTIPAPQTIANARAAVVTDSSHASQIGIDILSEGGNAVDAAVAVGFALAVTWPEAGNIGGGGFMMIHDHIRSDGFTSPPVMVDYRETAPAASTEDMFEIGESAHQCKAVGTPGTVRGLALAHEKYGSLPWRDLVLPAAGLADNGFAIDDDLARSINTIIEDSASFTELQRIFGHPDGRPWQAGDILKQPDLARTLRIIADRGPAGFYQGEIADLIVTEMNAADTGQGIITARDLTRYLAVRREPVVIDYRDHKIYAPNLPSSGGITLAMILNMLQPYDLQAMGRWSPNTMHLLIEVYRRAYLERAKYLGDSDFVAIPDKLTGREHARELMASFDPDRATISVALPGVVSRAAGGESTTHFSIIDRRGMCVSNTYTLENSWGSRVVVRGGGFLLNNEMGDFNWKVGYTDNRGRIGTKPNRIQPNKRMLSSMTPVIVTNAAGEVVLITGSPGGRTIITTVAGIIINVIDFNMTPDQAVHAPRLHHQWLPDEARFELSAAPDYRNLIKALQAKGHTFATPKTYGSAHTIEVDPATDTATATADRRRAGDSGAKAHE